MEEYEYLEVEDFLNLLNAFVKMEVGNVTISGLIYEDSKIKIFSRYVDFASNLSKVYRVDRKQFLESKNLDLRNYPNIALSYGSKLKDVSYVDQVVRYSREIGYIIPHIKNMLYDDSYRMQEKVMYILEN